MGPRDLRVDRTTSRITECMHTENNQRLISISAPKQLVMTLAKRKVVKTLKRSLESHVSCSYMAHDAVFLLQGRSINQITHRDRASKTCFALVGRALLFVHYLHIQRLHK